MTYAESRGVVMRLLEAGANPADANARLILGLGEPEVDAIKSVKKSEFRRQAKRQFGQSNPQRMNHCFWEAMIRDGVNAYQAGVHFGMSNFDFDGPVWCADRFGQSLTLLPDGRAVQIGGEHEDSYDPDFCIYNEVFIHEPGGPITILGYPEKVFPPTDFHTATLIDDAIVIIGRLGYRKQREFDQTPVFRLKLNTWEILPIATTGDRPGWIFKHRAELITPNKIRVWGGEVAEEIDGQESHRDNQRAFILNLSSREWRGEASS